VEIIDVYKIKDYNNEYIGKVKSINRQNIDKDINTIITIPSNFKLEK
jgi:hypothetical protein